MVATQNKRRVRPLVDGEARDGTGRVAVVDRTTDDAFATVEIADSATVDSAVDAARGAIPTELETGVIQRATWCEAIATAIRDRAATLADALVREAGVTITSARAEVETAAAQFDGVAEALRSLTGKHRTWTTAREAGDNSLVSAAPLGVVRCQPSERAPVATTALQVAPAVGAGNGVVVTAPAATPVAASLLTELVADRLPEGAVGFVPVESDDHPDDGSDGADAVLAAETGTGTPGITRFQRRLGGGTTALVFPDADITAAAAAIAGDGPSTVERRLAGPCRVLAHESIQDELVEHLDGHLTGWTSGDLLEETTTVAPQRDAAGAERLAYYVDDAVTKGATLVRGGEADGPEFAPTLLADVPADAALLVDDQPAPVVPVAPFDSEGDALERAAAGPPAQAVTVFTERHSLVMQVADAVEAGAIGVGSGGVEERLRSLDGQRAREAVSRLTRTKRVVQ